MKISCLQENLSKGLGVVSRLVATKSSLEILSYILLSVDDGRLKLSATNLEMGINYKIGGKIDKEGSITLPARLFSDLINQLPSGKLDIVLDGDTVSVKSSNYSSHIKGLPADDFPLIPKIKEGKVLSINATEFKEAVNSVVFASAINDTRPALNGVYIKTDKNKMYLVATDSYRLAEKKIDVKNSKNIEVIVPVRSMQELVRIIGEYDGNVDIYANENQVMFVTPDFEFISRLVEGKFPDYQQIIPTATETKVVCNAEEFLNIIKVASLFSEESAVSLSANPKGKLTAYSSSSQFGDSTGNCEAEVEGKEIEIVFNSKYIIDLLTIINSGKVELSLNGKLNPGLFKKKGDQSFRYVIMPLRG